MGTNRQGTSKGRISTSLVLAVVLLLVRGAFAQQPEPSRALGRALEIRYSESARPMYWTIPASSSGGSIVLSDLPWDPSWNRADNTLPQALAIRLRSGTEGNAVQVDVSVLLNVLTTKDTLNTLKSLPEEIVGSYFAHLNQSVILEGLVRYGIEPLEIKVVTNKPSTPNPPKIVNKTVSLRVEAVEEDLTSYRLSLHNVGPLAITAFATWVLDQNSRKISGRSVDSGPSGPVIPREAVYRVQVEKGLVGGSASPERLIATPPQPVQVVIQTAVLANGIYEGDEGETALILGLRLGRKLQGIRVMAILKNMLEKTVSAEQVFTDTIAQVRALPVRADRLTVEEGMAQYPALPASASRIFQEGVQRGLAAGQGRMTSHLREYERAKVQNPGQSFASFWEDVRGQYERDLN